jgi:hypothetical protein
MKLRPIDVSYRQLAVFQAALPNPFNNWTDPHVAQGFAWRHGSVSFATLEEAGAIDTEVARAAPARTTFAARIIAVPFEVDASGAVEVASIGDGVALKLPPGSYRLTFEHGASDTGRMWCRLWFEPVSSGEPVEAAVVKADPTLTPGARLLMEAEPA